MTAATTQQQAAFVSIVEKVARTAYMLTKEGASEDEVVRVTRRAAEGALVEVTS